MYFNEFDPFAAAWLKQLFPTATVDQRSIVDVTADDVIQFDRCHFFGGIGGWDLALHLAGWPAGRPVWTGSCPCQPYSAAGKQKGQEDERHLWPEMFRLIRECRPDTVFGEQVARAIGFGWLDGVFADLEGAGYTCGTAVLGAHSVGAPHIRQRLYWVAQSQGEQQQRGGQPRLDPQSNGEPEQDGLPSSRGGGPACWTRCDCCENFICNIHGMHAHDCECPPIDEWECDPYSTTVSEWLVFSRGTGLERHAGHVGCGSESGWVTTESDGPIAATGSIGSRLSHTASNGREQWRAEPIGGGRWQRMRP